MPQAKRLIGISANRVELPVFMTVQELLQFQAQQFAGDAKVRKSQAGASGSAIDWASDFGLTPFMRTKVGDLSLGNYKKLSLIMALRHQLQLLLFDEPSNGLEEQARAVLSRVLANSPCKVIIASREPMSAGDLPIQHIPLADLLGNSEAAVFESIKSGASKTA